LVKFVKIIIDCIIIRIMESVIIKGIVRHLSLFFKNRPIDIFNEINRCYPETCPSRRTNFNWVNDFRSGGISIKKFKSPGRPRGTRTSEMMLLIIQIIKENRKTSIREIKERTGLSH